MSVDAVIAYVVKVAFNARLACCVFLAHISVATFTFLYFRTVVVLATQYAFYFSHVSLNSIWYKGSDRIPDWSDFI